MSVECWAGLRFACNLDMRPPPSDDMEGKSFHTLNRAGNALGLELAAICLSGPGTEIR